MRNDQEIRSKAFESLKEGNIPMTQLYVESIKDPVIKCQVLETIKDIEKNLASNFFDFKPRNLLKQSDINDIIGPINTLSCGVSIKEFRDIINNHELQRERFSCTFNAAVILIKLF